MSEGLALLPGVPLGQCSLQTGLEVGLHGWEVATLPRNPGCCLTSQGPAHGDHAGQ